MIPFALSIAALSLVQGLLVALPGAPDALGLAALRARRWAVVPPASVIGFVAVASAAERASAQGLTYLALVAVPLLAALALGWLAHGARPALALLALPLFALAWAERGTATGQSAALALSALSCVALGVLLAAVTPPRWLAAGIVAMALADTALVVSDLLQKPNQALNAAHPAAGLPRLQSAVFGSAVMGYGDLFVAAVLGGLLASTMGRRLQLGGAALAAVLALCFDLLFLFVNELPATVPPALTLLALMVLRGGLGPSGSSGPSPPEASGARARSAGRDRAGGAAPAELPRARAPAARRVGARRFAPPAGQ
jgi:hypothetical protein